MKELYVRHNFTPATRVIVEDAIRIIEVYEEEGFSLTLRQLFYQFVARELLPNTQRSYKRLGSIVNDARLAGLIDWDTIKDRTRFVRRVPSWENPREILMNAANGYKIDPWLDQPQMVEVWIEKDALIGVIEKACNKWRVPLFSCRGYTSQSSLYSAAQRHKWYLEHPKRTVDLDELWILHLGDHDPSGIDMTRDIGDRLDMLWSDAIVDRIALNMGQVNGYHLPANPAKLTDSRCGHYIKKYGHDSWELDAMPPGDMMGLVNETIEGHIDSKAWATSLEGEEEQRKELRKIATAF